MKLIPKNWKAFQHYKDRSPPWIKLHKGLLDDRSYQRLPIASRALAPMLWLMASDSKEGVFDGSIEELAFRLRCADAEIQAGLTPLIEAGFFTPVEASAVTGPINTQAACGTAAGMSGASCDQCASGVLADCGQVAVPETETETETETEGEKETDTSAGAEPVGKADLPGCNYQKLIDAYHEALPELPKVRLLQDGRKKVLTKVWRWVLTSKTAAGERRATNADEAIAWFVDYFNRAATNDFLMGRTQRSGQHSNWRATLDFLLTDRGMTHVIERTEVQQ